MNSENATMWPIVEPDHGESVFTLERPFREEVEYSQATPADTMEKSACFSTNASGGESDGEDERSCRSKRGKRRKLKEDCSDKHACNSVWSDARTSITSQATPLAVAIGSTYSMDAPLTPLGFSVSGSCNPPVESVSFDCNTSAFSFPNCRLSPKRRRLSTYSEAPVQDGLENSYMQAEKTISRNRLWSEAGDSEANGSVCTEDSNDSDLVVLSGLVARASNMLEDAVAYRSDSYVSKFIPSEDLIENIGEENIVEEEVYDPHNSFKPLKRYCA
jgi:hypothetical protein